MDSLLLIPERSLFALHLRLFSNFETKIGKNPDILEKSRRNWKKSREIGKNAANWKKSRKFKAQKELSGIFMCIGTL